MGGALAAWRAAKRWRSHERSETRKGAAPLGATPKESTLLSSWGQVLKKNVQITDYQLFGRF